MAEIIDLSLPEPLKHRDGEPVADVPGLIWFQDVWIPEAAWLELAQPQTNGWIRAA